MEMRLLMPVKKLYFLEYLTSFFFKTVCATLLSYNYSVFVKQCLNLRNMNPRYTCSRNSMLSEERNEKEARFEEMIYQTQVACVSSMCRVGTCSTPIQTTSANPALRDLHIECERSEND